MNYLVSSTTPELISKVESYLAEEISHEEIAVFAWKLADHSPKHLHQDEEAFWSTVFTIIHLADPEHWKDGCTQRDLGQLLELLKSGKSIPEEWKK